MLKTAFLFIVLALPTAVFAQTSNGGQPSQADQQQAIRDTMGEMALSLAETRAQLLMAQRQVAVMQAQIKTLMAAKDPPVATTP